MEHTNLFLYETQTELEVAYPDGKVTGVTPAVAYARDEGTVLFNNKKTTYEITVSFEDRSGNTMASSETIMTPEVLDGNAIKVVIYPAVPEEDARPVSPSQKITVTGDTEFVYLYNVLTSYTVTVRHECNGSAITADTEVEVDAYEEETVRVTLVPEEVVGFIGHEVTISVSGDCTYALEYEEVPTVSTVDLGLPSGTLWATCNVGASAPEEYGDYFAWGETATKDEYTLDNYVYYYEDPEQAIRGGEITKYNSSDGKVTLDPEDDAATVAYGGDWHMPSSAQCQELFDNTSGEVSIINGITGILFTSNNNGNTIFFPFAGRSDDGGSGGEVIKGSDLYDHAQYWASTRGWEGYDDLAFHMTMTYSNEPAPKEAKGATRSIPYYDIVCGEGSDKYFGASVRGVIGNDPVTPIMPTE